MPALKKILTRSASRVMCMEQAAHAERAYLATASEGPLMAFVSTTVTANLATLLSCYVVTALLILLSEVVYDVRTGEGRRN